MYRKTWEKKSIVIIGLTLNTSTIDICVKRMRYDGLRLITTGQIINNYGCMASFPCRPLTRIAVEGRQQAHHTPRRVASFTVDEGSVAPCADANTYNSTNFLSCMPLYRTKLLPKSWRCLCRQHIIIVVVVVVLYSVPYDSSWQSAPFSSCAWSPRLSSTTVQVLLSVVVVGLAGSTSTTNKFGKCLIESTFRFWSPPQSRGAPFFLWIIATSRDAGCGTISHRPGSHSVVAVDVDVENLLVPLYVIVCREGP